MSLTFLFQVSKIAQGILLTNTQDQFEAFSQCSITLNQGGITNQITVYPQGDSNFTFAT